MRFDPAEKPEEKCCEDMFGKCMKCLKRPMDELLETIGARPLEGYTKAEIDEKLDQICKTFLNSLRSCEDREAEFRRELLDLIDCIICGLPKSAERDCAWVRFKEITESL